MEQYEVEVGCPLQRLPAELLRSILSSCFHSTDDICALRASSKWLQEATDGAVTNLELWLGGLWLGMYNKNHMPKGSVRSQTSCTAFLKHFLRAPDAFIQRFSSLTKLSVGPPQGIQARDAYRPVFPEALRMLPPLRGKLTSLCIAGPPSTKGEKVGRQQLHALAAQCQMLHELRLSGLDLGIRDEHALQPLGILSALTSLCITDMAHRFCPPPPLLPGLRHLQIGHLRFTGSSNSSGDDGVAGALACLTSLTSLDCVGINCRMLPAQLPPSSSSLVSLRVGCAPATQAAQAVVEHLVQCAGSSLQHLDLHAGPRFGAESGAPLSPTLACAITHCRADTAHAIMQVARQAPGVVATLSAMGSPTGPGTPAGLACSSVSFGRLTHLALMRVMWPKDLAELSGAAATLLPQLRLLSIHVFSYTDDFAKSARRLDANDAAPEATSTAAFTPKRRKRSASAADVNRSDLSTPGQAGASGLNAGVSPSPGSHGQPSPHSEQERLALHALSHSQRVDVTVLPDAWGTSDAAALQLLRSLAGLSSVGALSLHMDESCSCAGEALAALTACSGLRELHISNHDTGRYLPPAEALQHMSMLIGLHTLSAAPVFTNLRKDDSELVDEWLHSFARAVAGLWQAKGSAMAAVASAQRPSAQGSSQGVQQQAPPCCIGDRMMMSAGQPAACSSQRYAPGPAQNAAPGQGAVTRGAVSCNRGLRVLLHGLNAWDGEGAEEGLLHRVNHYLHQELSQHAMSGAAMGGVHAGAVRVDVDRAWWAEGLALPAAWRMQWPAELS